MAHADTSPSTCWSGACCISIESSLRRHTETACTTTCAREILFIGLVASQWIHHSGSTPKQSLLYLVGRHLRNHQPAVDPLKPSFHGTPSKNSLSLIESTYVALARRSQAYGGTSSSAAVVHVWRTLTIVDEILRNIWTLDWTVRATLLEVINLKSKVHGVSLCAKGPICHLGFRNLRAMMEEQAKHSTAISKSVMLSTSY